MSHGANGQSSRTADAVRIAIEQFLARNPTLNDETQAYLRQLYLETLTNPESDRDP